MFSLAVQAGLIVGKAWPTLPEITSCFKVEHDSNPFHLLEITLDFCHRNISPPGEDQAPHNPGIAVEHAVLIQVGDDPGCQQPAGVV